MSFTDEIPETISTRPLGLFDLPTEIRLEIYRYVFEVPKPCRHWADEFGKEHCLADHLAKVLDIEQCCCPINSSGNGLIASCRQIFDEGCAIFYSPFRIRLPVPALHCSTIDEWWRYRYNSNAFDVTQKILSNTRILQPSFVKRRQLQLVQTLVLEGLNPVPWWGRFKPSVFEEDILPPGENAMQEQYWNLVHNRLPALRRIRLLFGFHIFERDTKLEEFPVDCLTGAVRGRHVTLVEIYMRRIGNDDKLREKGNKISDLIVKAIVAAVKKEADSLGKRLQVRARLSSGDETQLGPHSPARDLDC